MQANHTVTHKKRVPPAAWICLTLAVLLATTGALFAKYRSEMKKQAEMISAGFHISSNYLEEPSKKATYSVSNMASDKIVIDLYNYEKENIAQLSQVDMIYEATVTGGKIGGADKITGTIPKTTTTASHSLTITPDTGATTVTVTVKTTKPYTKTLSATFNLTGKATAEVSVIRKQDNGDYYLVTIRSNQESGDRTLTWPADLLPDNTNPVMRGWTGTSGTFTMSAYTTYELMFFNPKGVEDLTNTHFPLS